MKRAGVAWIILVFAVVGTFAGWGLVSSVAAQCHYARQSYDALRRVTIQQNLPQKPSPIILRAFPQFLPFYTPGTPEYAETQRLARVKVAGALDALGSRPSC